MNRRSPIRIASRHARRAGREAMLALRLAAKAPGGLLRAALMLVVLCVRRVLEILLALLLLFEEWGWKPLSVAMAWLAKLRLVARAEAVIVRLPPYGALAAFVLPSVVLFPLKLLALYLIATGHAVLAGLLFVGAKLVGTAVVARLYMLTAPALMQIGWFARAYRWFSPRKDALFAAIRASWAWRYGRIVKYKVQHRLNALVQVWRPVVRGLADRVSARLRGWLPGKR